MRLDAARCILRPWRTRDRTDLIEAANDRQIWRNLADRFPYPYTLRDADDWIDHCEHEEPPMNLAIEVDGRAAGGVGVEPLGGEHRCTAVVGYWLAQRLWGRGITTDALRAFVPYVFDRYPVDRLQASVFGWNRASARVLEKCGFRLEGQLRNAVLKDGEFTDELVYGLLRSEQGPSTPGGESVTAG